MGYRGVYHIGSIFLIPEYGSILHRGIIFCYSALRTSKLVSAGTGIFLATSALLSGQRGGEGGVIGMI